MKLRFKRAGNDLRADRSLPRRDPNETDVLRKAWVKKAFHEMPYRPSSAFALTLTVKCPAHRAIRWVYRIFFMEYFKTKRKKKTPKKPTTPKNSKTFQGNKSPCDSDCLFNNIKKKRPKGNIAWKLPNDSLSAQNDQIWPPRSWDMSYV